MIITRELNGGKRTYGPSRYENDILYIEHTGGPFSSATIALQDIMIFFNDCKKLPSKIDRSKQFNLCKVNQFDFNEDITKIIYQDNDNYFEYDRERIIIDLPKLEPDEKVEGTFPAHGIYKDISFDDVNPFLEKYFQPSNEVVNRVNMFENKYNIKFKNTCYILYRGIEKQKEMPISSYDFFIEKAKSLDNGQMVFFIQTDEVEFLHACQRELNNVFFIEECIMETKDPNQSMFHKLNPNLKKDHLINYYASILLGSKCEYAITHTGNGGFWLSLYRGNSKNLYQAICGNSEVCGNVYHLPSCFNIWINS